MAATLEQFERLGLDTSCLGLMRATEEPGYFCTPKGAKTFGTAGVDGIHFCFVKGFWEMVFAVSPMNTPGEYVHPLSETFEAFLRLLLACGDTAALEQAHGWTQEQFDSFLLENPITPQQQAALDTIAAELKLTPMEQPFSYLKKVQNAFDDSRIPYTEEYAQCIPVEPKLPEWKVYFEGNFWGHSGADKAGQEITVRKEFDWAGHRWLIPSVYSTAKGLVIDFCMRVPQAELRAFLDKWGISPENDGSDLSDEERMAADAENPLSVDFRTKATVNGRALRQSHGCGVCWNPCFPELNGMEAKAVLEHYGLDSDDAWAICRVCLPWATRRRPQIKTLSVHLERNPAELPGTHFHVHAPGDTVSFVHPTTGVEYTLTVQEYEQQELPERAFPDANCEYPTHCIAMGYTVTPELGTNELTLQDCSPGDRPRQKCTDPCAPEATFDCCVGIIGGADGPTAVFITGSTRSHVRTACSSLHFEPTDDVEWRIVFHEKMTEDLELTLLK